MAVVLAGLFIGTFVALSAPAQAVPLAAGVLGFSALVVAASGLFAARALGLLLGVVLALLGHGTLQVLRIGDYAAARSCIGAAPVVLRVRIAQPPIRRMSVDGQPQALFLAEVLDSRCAALRKRLISLSWLAPPELKLDQALLLRVVLRPIRGTVNRAAIGRELRLSAAGVLAAGRVTRLLRVDAPRRGLQMLRERLAVLFAGSAFSHGGAVLALLTGDARHLPAARWQDLQRTGTVHLLVISGLHVGVLAALLAWLLRRLCAPFSGRWPAMARPLSQAAMGAVALAGYVQFSGAGIAVQRAAAMAAFAWLLLARARVADPARALLLAWLLLALSAPASALTGGYWLSFGLTAWLLMAARADLAGPSGTGLTLVGRRLGLALRWQSSLWLLTLPALAWLRLPLAPLALPANLLAVPWVTVLLVPMIVVGLLAWLLHPPSGLALWRLADVQLDGLFGLLNRVAELLPAWRGPDRLTAAMALLVLALLVITPGWRALRLAALLAVAIGLLPLPTRPWLSAGEFRVDVLDVGQGLAVLVHTRGRTLLYDTGVAWPNGTPRAATVIEPALAALRRRPTRTLVSHADLDHAGGVAYLRQRGLLGRLLGAGGEACDGVSWRWDGVTFTVLQALRGRGNDASCVLLVHGRRRLAVLAGDIERHAEAQLLSRLPARVDLLLVPHHGSQTSSGRALLARLRPRFAVYSAAAGNRFGHPHPEVVARYRRFGAVVAGTDRSGELRWWSNSPWRLWRARCERPRRWALGVQLLPGGSCGKGQLAVQHVYHAPQLGNQQVFVSVVEESADFEFLLPLGQVDAPRVPAGAGGQHMYPGEEPFEAVAFLDAADA